MKKIRHFSHNDLDGMGCGVIAKAAWKTFSVYQTFCGYNTINDRVTDFLKSYPQSGLLITDLSVTPEVAELINQHPSPKYIVDHHQSAFDALSYDWCVIDPEARSGCELLYKFLQERGFDKEGKYAFFVEQVSQWDSWEWASKEPRNLLPCQLNDLASSMTPWDFVSRFVFNPDLDFKSEDRAIIDAKARARETFFYFLKSRVRTFDLQYTENGEEKSIPVDSVLAEADMIHASDWICNHPEATSPVKIVINVPAKHISFRSQEVDVSKLAEAFGGGGHKTAAGATIEKETLMKILEHAL